MLTETAQVGNAMLIQALRCQENHQEYGMDGKKSYINERSRYGKREPLRRNALLLYLCTLFSSPDSNGFVRFHIEDFAEKIGCTPRSADANLKLLQDRDYLSFTKGEGDLRMAFLTGYRDFFLPANRGGRGYLCMPKSVLDKLCGMEGINRIRVTLRTWMELASEENKKKHSPDRTYRSMARWLPKGRGAAEAKRYVTDGSLSGIASCTVKKRYAIFSIAPEASPVAAMEGLKARCRSMMKDLEEKLTKEAESNGTKGPHFSTKDISDAADIALRLPLGTIQWAAEHIWRQYLAKGIHVGSFGALLRTVASDRAYAVT